MKPNPNSKTLVDLYVEVMQRPMSMRYNLKQVIFDLIPAKRLLYQVFMPGMRDHDYNSGSIQSDQLSAHDFRFISFLESTDITVDQLNLILQAHANMADGIPEKYGFQAQMHSSGFKFYGRKFGRQPLVSSSELDSLYSRN